MNTMTPPEKSPERTQPTANDALLKPEERVLPTLEQDGKRRWLNPKPSSGRMLRWRTLLGYVLIGIFTIVPHVRVSGRPLLLIDIPNRELTVGGYTFLPTDTILLALFMIAVFLTIVLATAVFGRVWCGWACPQTVYMELVFRPLERLFHGTTGRGGVPKKPVPGWRIFLKYVTFLAISAYLAHTFLAYFVGTEALAQWVTQSPLKHPTPFLVMLFVTAAMMFDFCFFREQLCLIACPYGRFQSVLLDQHSVIVSYDKERGEPRGRLKKKNPLEVVQGDCVDCKLCVTTCPTGIDIRDGLQMECIHCAQCIDACNQVMTRLKRPRGLIRYSSQAAMSGLPRKFLRARVVIYPTILLVVLGAFTGLLLTKKSFDAKILRGMGNPFTEIDGGLVENRAQLKVTNRDDSPNDLTIAIEGNEILLVTQQTTVSLAAHEGIEIPVILRAPAESFEDGRLEAQLKITSASGDERTIDWIMLGPINAR